MQNLKNDIFETSHGIVEAEPYYEKCMADVCTCDRDIDSCMCDAFTAYPNECIRNDKGGGNPFKNAVNF